MQNCCKGMHQAAKLIWTNISCQLYDTQYTVSVVSLAHHRAPLRWGIFYILHQPTWRNIVILGGPSRQKMAAPICFAVLDDLKTLVRQNEWRIPGCISEYPIADGWIPAPLAICKTNHLHEKWLLWTYLIFSRQRQWHSFDGQNSPVTSWDRKIFGLHGVSTMLLYWQVHNLTPQATLWLTRHSTLMRYHLLTTK